MRRLHTQCLGLSLLLASCAVAQTAAPAPASVAPAAPVRTTPMDAHGAPIASDPILVLPPDQLTPTEVHRLQALVGDYGQLARYRGDNTRFAAADPGRVVFFGDSITDAWGRRKDAAPFFPGKPYVNRGISGQTTPQMVVRFQQDVVALKPAAVVILAGTNDLAGNTGVESMTDIENSFRAMGDLATANHIKVIVSSVLPVDDYAWRRGLGPVEKVRTLNAWLKQLCTERGYTYLDYYTALATPEGAMKPGTSSDGVHPTAAGYALMAPLAQAAIDQALAGH
jgi:lysophospholipase L1-like esterase